MTLRELIAELQAAAYWYGDTTPVSIADLPNDHAEFWWEVGKVTYVKGEVVIS